MQNKRYLLILALLIIPTLTGIIANTQPVEAAIPPPSTEPPPEPTPISCTRDGGECPPNSFCDFSLSSVPDNGLCVRGDRPLVPDCGQPGNPCTFAHFFKLISNVIDFVIRALAPILVILFMALGGFYMMISRGNPTQFNRGKGMIVWALIGYALILAAWIIVNTLLTSIGIVDGLDITNWYIINF